MRKHFSIEEDKLNLHKTRNIRNIRKKDYNCGGYALETFNWYVPAQEWEDYDYSLSGDLTRKTKDSVESMIKEFNGRLRVIDTERDICENEICIAFRVGGDDFHYAKKSKNGQWRHKKGGRTYLEFMTKTELYSPDGWCYGEYNGALVFLALKK